MAIMGFHLRKSIKVGPLRFNLSKSGVGVSAGIKGFRVGMGPRGNYVHAGIGGFHYRATVPRQGGQEKRAITRQKETPELLPAEEVLVAGALEEIESVDASEMKDSCAAALLADINERRRRFQFINLVPPVMAVLLYFSFRNMPDFMPFVFLLAIPATLITKYVDILRRTAVLLYEFDEIEETAYGNMLGSFEQLSKTKSAWQIEASGDVIDTKRTAGASSLVRRVPVKFSCKQPPLLKINFDPPVLPAGKQTLVFLPDTLLVLQKDRAGAVSYDDLKILVGESPFAETGGVPSDTMVVGKTWRYVNKSGGPDKRFKDNQEIPVVSYGEIRFQSASGLKEFFQVSNPNLLLAFVEELGRYGNRHKPVEEIVEKEKPKRRRKKSN